MLASAMLPMASLNEPEGGYMFVKTTGIVHFVDSHWQSGRNEIRAEVSKVTMTLWNG